MILEAKHHPFIYPFFKWFSVFIVRRNFRKIVVNNRNTNRHLPVLLLANHVSWWDGFWAMYLNVKIFKKKFHFMMLENQLRKYWYFNYTGGYSIHKNSRSVVESLQYTCRLLSDRNNLVLIFPQGEIHSMHHQNFVFEKGLQRIVQNVKNEFQIVFLVALTDYFSKSMPSLYLYLTDYKGNNFSFTEIEASYNEFYKQCLKQQTAIKE